MECKRFTPRRTMNLPENQVPTECGDTQDCSANDKACVADYRDNVSRDQDCVATPELSLQREPRQARPWDTDLTQRTESTESKSPDSSDSSPLRVARRWDRLVRLVGNDGARKLLQSHVTVFGLGGVGGYVAETLARSAIGSLTLVDFDDVCVTNVNRQIQAFPASVGQSKAKLLAARLSAINPDANIEPVQAFYEAATSDALLTPQPDFVVDAIDNVTAKVHLLKTCLERNISVVSITGAGARWDPTQVRVADLSETKVDPLARILRKEFGRRGIDTSREVGIPVVYSEEDVCEPEVPSWDEEAGFQCICPHREDSPHACEKRRVIYGTASFVTSAFAAAATSVVVRSLIK